MSAPRQFGKSHYQTLCAAAAIAAGKRVAFCGPIQIADGAMESIAYFPSDTEKKELIAWRLRHKYGLTP